MSYTTDEQGTGAAAARIGSALSAALVRARREEQRLRHADTTVAFTVAGDRGPSPVLVLGADGCSVKTGREAEVELVLDEAQVASLTQGTLAMTDAVVTGAIEARGPVRRYLEVDVIVRRLLLEGADRLPEAPARAARRVGAGPIPPELLAIETRGLRKSFGSNTVLDGLDLTIPEGVIAVLLGPSGTGKSVCLSHVIGLMEPDGGEVLVRERSLRGMTGADLRRLRRGVGVMFQDGALFSTMDVFDNVAFPLRQHTDMDEVEVRHLVEEQLRLVGLSDAATRTPSQLSGGMRKRAGLARAMILNPGIVLCDEPDSGLDPVRTALLGDLLLERHAEHGGTMVVVTHNVALARAMADHISVLWRGRVLASGMAPDVLGSDEPFIRQFLRGDGDGPLGMDA